ncbi:MAG: hypothetical protein M0P31_16995 [Solirubrobacteraceae bacterium]|nr:hypothetical protein [Solirubrobacteraceae bacterium]
MRRLVCALRGHRWLTIRLGHVEFSRCPRCGQFLRRDVEHVATTAPASYPAPNHPLPHPSEGITR